MCINVKGCVEKLLTVLSLKTEDTSFVTDSLIPPLLSAPESPIICNELVYIYIYIYIYKYKMKGDVGMAS